MYETTLVSDETPFDQFMEGNKAALSDAQQRGMALFNGKGLCIHCHSGAELTKASVRTVGSGELERAAKSPTACAIFDTGFYNIGVRRTREDLSLGGTDPFGNPLSMTRLAQNGEMSDPNLTPSLGTYPVCDRHADVHGAFKVPGLRNIELTAPYFHNGGQRTLEQVIDFYNRGGDFNEANIADLDPGILNLGLSQSEKSDLVAFLLSLTDERVRHHRAPFDHPQIFVPHGEVEVNGNVVLDAYGRPQDYIEEVQATGKAGGPKIPGSFLYF
jgi:cytochrome c peroxidase